MAPPAESRSAYRIRVVGTRRHLFADVYHAFLRAPWAAALGAISGAYLAINALFALGYLFVGGVVHARPGSFLDAFVFSVQTMGTIGYGAMYPESAGAHALVVAESVVGLAVTALATGLVFAKFSRPTGRVAFSKRACVAPMDGVPTLAFRVGNERGNQIVEAQIRVAAVRTVRTREGVTFYRMVDLALARDRSPAVTRSWTVLHPVTEGSPLHGHTPESLATTELELIVTINGTDDTSMQPVHARHTYYDRDIVWGARLADILSETEDGDLVVDIDRFHDVVPAAPTPEFPYPRG